MSLFFKMILYFILFFFLQASLLEFELVHLTRLIHNALRTNRQKQILFQRMRKDCTMEKKIWIERANTNHFAGDWLTANFDSFRNMIFFLPNRKPNGNSSRFCLLGPRRARIVYIVWGRINTQPKNARRYFVFCKRKTLGKNKKF